MKKAYILLAMSVAFFVLAVSFLVVRVQGVGATNDPYKVICHHTPANEVTLSFQNEQSYSGHLGTPHNDETFDTDGACAEPSATPTATPECEEDEDCFVATPTPTASASATPVVTPAPTTEGGSGVSDNLGCSVKDCSVHPTPAPVTTLAETGSFKENMFLGVTGFGALLIALGLAL